jgi:CRISPR-associated endonuclease/helicase Cas3
VLYKEDDRFAITRDKLTVKDHRAILENKDFDRLYNQVLAGRNNLNQKVGIENFYTKYLPDVQQLDYEKIHTGFKLIDQRNLSVFVPLLLPIEVEGEASGTPEAVFSGVELQFLKIHQCYADGDGNVDGSKVWPLYRELQEVKMGIVESQVKKKIMQGILSKFTFSIFYSKKLKNELICFSDPGQSFEEYLYLSHHEKVYNYYTGLDQDRFNTSDDLFL